MRLIKISAPEGKGKDIVALALSAGIEEPSITQAEFYRSEKESRVKDIVDIQTSTPKAKHFIGLLLKEDYYDEKEFSISTRQPASIISDTEIRGLTIPLAIPPTDILQELWQFSHITVSFVGRVFIGGALLAFGLISHQILAIVAGLLFLPLLPLLLAVSFGIRSMKYKLVLQGLAAFVTACIVLILSGMAAALFSSPPVKYDEFNSLAVSFVISLAVGIAAVLAHVDDGGKRELIGLAAMSQIAIIPTWFGACWVLGFPGSISQNEIIAHGENFFLNIITIVVTSLVTYTILESAGNFHASKANRS
jgi:hypothetical protein